MLIFRFRSESYIKFIKRQPCTRCIHFPPKEITLFHRLIDPEHTKSQKFRDGSDALAIPLCRVCHTLCTSMRKERFWREFMPGVSKDAEIEALHLLYLEEQEIEQAVLCSEPSIRVETFEQTLLRHGLGTVEKKPKPSQIRKRPSRRKNRRPFTKRVMLPDRIL